MWRAKTRVEKRKRALAKQGEAQGGDAASASGAGKSGGKAGGGIGVRPASVVGPPPDRLPSGEAAPIRVPVPPDPRRPSVPSPVPVAKASDPSPSVPVAKTSWGPKEPSHRKTVKCWKIISPRHPVIFSAVVSNHLVRKVFRFHYHSRKVSQDH